jgi:hypothetical protein
METTTTTSSIPSQINKNLATTLAGADTQVKQGVNNLTLVHKARLSQLTRTAASLKAEYGADDPGVKSAEASVTATTTTAARISLILQQITATAPTVAQTGWAVQGRVVDAQLNPLGKLTVFLVDGNKTYLRQYGFAYTDGTGLFLINYQGVAGQAQGVLQLYLEVADTNANPIYLDAAPFQPTIGSSTYRNVVLPMGQKPIGDPPEAIRLEAFPKPGADQKKGE